MRTKIIAGNWKMNKSLEEAKGLTSEIISMATSQVRGQSKVVLCVPFPYLVTTSGMLVNSAISPGAQNCSEHASGAYTGEVSAAMVKSAGAEYVIIGHSERREYFAENAKLLTLKINRVFEQGLTPIFCCGESLKIREQGTHESLVRTQVADSLFHLHADEAKKLVIAYEPVWAIGTGKTATSQQAQEMHLVIRKELANKYGDAISNSIPILYGGSVKPDNARELFSCPDVDGGLVGGASLKAQDFVEIIRGAA